MVHTIGGTTYTYTDVVTPAWIEAYALGINDRGVVVGWGTTTDVATGLPMMKGFIATPPPPTSVSPEDKIDGIIDTIDEALAGGDCDKVHMKGLEQTLTVAAHAVEKGKIKKACNKLDNAYDRVSKRLKSKKACVAQLAAEVQDQIQDVMEDLECKEEVCRH